jgi:hypothetical protein
MRINAQHAQFTAILVVACMATWSARLAQSQEILTYGVDPVPNSQYWSGPYETGYGVDPVPTTRLAEIPYFRKYGQDPIPDARIFTRDPDLGPLFKSEERLTQASDGVGTATRKRSAPMRTWRRGR